MAYNRYIGNTGQVIRVQDADSRVSAAAPPERHSGTEKPRTEKRPPSPPSLFGSGLGGLLSNLSPDKLELEDILLLLIFYLLYRESGDRDFLLMMGAMFLS